MATLTIIGLTRAKVTRDKTRLAKYPGLIQVIYLNIWRIWTVRCEYVVMTSPPGTPAKL